MSLGFINMIGITRCLNMTISCIYHMHIWCLLAAGKLELAYHLNCTQRIMLPNIILIVSFSLCVSQTNTSLKTACYHPLMKKYDQHISQTSMISILIKYTIISVTI